MAAPKFLRLLLGRPTEAYATEVGGPAAAEQIVATGPSGLLDPTLFPAGIGQDIVVAPASEALGAGALVNIYVNAGVTNVRKADASVAGKECNGFVLAAVSSGGSAAVYRSGPNTAVTGATPGDAFLSATVPGGTQSTPPTGTGQTVQKVGKAMTATMIDIQPGQDYVLA